MKLAVSAAFIFTLVLCATALAQEPATQNTKSVPLSYGLVIDNSGSMRTLLDRVISVVTEVVEQNGPDDEGFLVTFVDTPKIVLRQEFTDSKAELNDAAQNMFIEGGQAAILDAVRISVEYLARTARTDSGRSRALILVTDGDDRESGSKIDDVIRLLKEHEVRVFVIAIADGKIVTKLIDRLTKETGGAKFSPKTRAELAATATQMSAAIRTK
jgi:VWFA-related protein